MALESDQLLSNSKLHPHNHHTIIDDVSSSLPGLIAEEVAEENHLDVAKSNNFDQQTEDVEDAEDVEDIEEDFFVPKSQLYLVMPSLYSLVFLASLDATILSTLLADVASDLNAIPYISWIATSYLLSSSIVQPLGKLSDIFGRKCLLLICISVFVIGCLQCSLATTTLSFVIGRFLTGFAGGLNTLTTIIMSDLVPLRQRGLFQGFGNIFYALGAATGGSLGGYIAHNFGWRAAFWIQCPIGIACFIIIAFYAPIPNVSEEHPTSTAEKFKKVDFYGIFSMSTMMFLFVSLTSINFKSVTLFLVLLILFIASAAIFINVELSSPVPIVPLNLLKNRSVLGSSLSNLFGSAYVFAIIYYVPMYYVTVLNLDTQKLGILLIPTIIISSMSSVGAGYYMKLTGRYSRFIITTSFFGLLGISYLLARTIPFGLKIMPLPFERWILTCLPYSAYSAMLTVTLLSLIASVPIDYQSSVTSMQYAFRGSGSTLGMSIASLLFKEELGWLLNHKLVNVAPKETSEKELLKVIEKALHNAEYIRTGAPEWAQEKLVEFYAISCWGTFIFGFVCCVGMLISVCLIDEHGLTKKRNLA